MHVKARKHARNEGSLRFKSAPLRQPVFDFLHYPEREAKSLLVRGFAATEGYRRVDYQDERRDFRRISLRAPVTRCPSGKGGALALIGSWAMRIAMLARWKFPPEVICRESAPFHIQKWIQS